MAKPKGTKPLNINLSDELWAKIDRYRFKEMFATRTEAIVYLLTYALRQSPKRNQQSPKSEDR